MIDIAVLFVFIYWSSLDTFAVANSHELDNCLSSVALTSLAKFVNFIFHTLSWVGEFVGHFAKSGAGQEPLLLLESKEMDGWFQRPVRQRCAIAAFKSFWQSTLNASSLLLNLQSFELHPDDDHVSWTNNILKESNSRAAFPYSSPLKYRIYSQAKYYKVRLELAKTFTENIGYIHTIDPYVAYSPYYMNVVNHRINKIVNSKTNTP